jgi:hypothetical protein
MLVTALVATQAIACGHAEEDDAWASADLSPVPVTTADLVGFWESSALYQNMQIRDWNGSPLLSVDIPYTSDLVIHDVEFVLSTLDDPNTTTYVASSSVRVSWGDVHCSYPIDIVVLIGRAADGSYQLFIRDNRPIAFPESIPSSAQTCPPVTNTWKTHPDPYVKRTPVKQFDQMVDALCASVTAREGAVDGAKRLTTAPLPASLPANIYNASGDWQSLSSPGRDTTLRGNVRDIYKFVGDSLQGTDAHLNATRLLAAWNDRSAACHLSYKGSTGAGTPLALGDFVKRAYKISFDPYHCPELRWGADATAGAEFSTCNTQDDPHVKRYNDEQSLRNYLDRPNGSTTPLGSGPAQGQDIDFVALIERLAQ